MYDSPKTAHFIACDAAGEPFHHRDPVGLAARWAAADACGNIDMLRPSAEAANAIASACRRAGDQFRVTIRLADDELPRWSEFSEELGVAHAAS